VTKVLTVIHDSLDTRFEAKQNAGSKREILLRCGKGGALPKAIILTLIQVHQQPRVCQHDELACGRTLNIISPALHNADGRFRRKEQEFGLIEAVRNIVRQGFLRVPAWGDIVQKGREAFSCFTNCVPRHHLLAERKKLISGMGTTMLRSDSISGTADYNMALDSGIAESSFNSYLACWQVCCKLELSDPDYAEYSSGLRSSVASQI
jgi:hypothetical protein